MSIGGCRTSRPLTWTSVAAWCNGDYLWNSVSGMIFHLKIVVFDTAPGDTMSA
jgi:hypothetical protein